MATAPSEYLGSSEVFTWQPNTIAMHVTRPKSAKGRTRGSLSCSHSVESYSFRVPSPSQQDDAFEAPTRARDSASATSRALTEVRISQEDIPEILQQVPSRPSSSLNKYMVLPSIRTKGAGDNAGNKLAEQTSMLHLNDRLQEPSGKLLYIGSRSAKGKRQTKGPKGAVAKTPTAVSGKPPVTAKEQSSLLQMNLKEPLEEPRLLLAVRSPSGERYERYFRPTDSLQTIVAVTEQRATVQYKNCSIETMEVPRRSFSDLTKSLEECGIPNKSVLCIFQEEQY